MAHILEHCCYRKYLSEWYGESLRGGQESVLTVNYGDHTLADLLSWFVDMCYSSQNDVSVTIVTREVTDSTRQWLAENHKIHSLHICDPTDGTKQRGGWDGSQTIALVSGYGYYFTISGSVPQSYTPGRHLATVTFSRRHYDDIQPILASWLRMYSK